MSTDTKKAPKTFVVQMQPATGKRMSAEQVRLKALEMGKREPEGPTGLEYDAARREVRLKFGATALSIPARNIRELRGLTDEQLATMRLGHAGDALCVDDADIAIATRGLMQQTGTVFIKSLEAMTASLRGSIRTPQKAAAARSNGLLGGRPRKPLQPAPAVAARMASKKRS